MGTRAGQQPNVSRLLLNHFSYPYFTSWQQSLNAVPLAELFSTAPSWRRLRVTRRPTFGIYVGEEANTSPKPLCISPDTCALLLRDKKAQTLHTFFRRVAFVVDKLSLSVRPNARVTGVCIRLPRSVEVFL